MKWKILVFLLFVAIGSCADENGENEETTEGNAREIKEFDREVCIVQFFYIEKLFIVFIKKALFNVICVSLRKMFNTFL